MKEVEEKMEVSLDPWEVGKEAGGMVLGEGSVPGVGHGSSKEKHKSLAWSK